MRLDGYGVRNHIVVITVDSVNSGLGGRLEILQKIFGDGSTRFAGMTLSVAKGKRHICPLTVVCVAGSKTSPWYTTLPVHEFDDIIAVRIRYRHTIAVPIERHQLRQIELAIGRVDAFELVGRHRCEACIVLVVGRLVVVEVEEQPFAENWTADRAAELVELERRQWLCGVLKVASCIERIILEMLVEGAHGTGSCHLL